MKLTHDETLALRRSRHRASRGAIRVVHVPVGAGTERSQVLFAVPTSVGSSPARNRVRRRIRAVLSGLALPPGLWLFSVRDDLQDLEHPALTVALESLVARSLRGDLERRARPRPAQRSEPRGGPTPRRR